jgi:hypothetical protein
MKKLNIDISEYIIKEKNKIKDVLIQHIKSKLLDIEIDDEDLDDDIYYLFTITFEYNEEFFDSIRFDLASEDGVEFVVISYYNDDFIDISSIEDLDKLIDIFLNNVRNGIISETPEWVTKIIDNETSAEDIITKTITRDIAEQDIDLN